MESPIDKPIFILGPGRSGTTLFYNMIAAHPDTSWFSSWTVRLPELPWLSLLSRYRDLSLSLSKVAKLPVPSEAIPLWNYFCPGYSKAQKDWTENHIDPVSIAQIKQVVATHLRWQGKSRFCAKKTGYPFIAFFRAIFPDAVFFYINRDPRAVIYSRMKQKWGFKDAPDQLDRFTPQEKLDLYVKSFLMEHEAKNAYVADKDYHQVYYEQLVRNPVEVIIDCCNVAELPISDKYLKVVRQWEIQLNTNEQWRTYLDQNEIAYLTEMLRHSLEELDYL